MNISSLNLLSALVSVTFFSLSTPWSLPVGYAVVVDPGFDRQGIMLLLCQLSIEPDRDRHIMVPDLPLTDVFTM